MTHLEKYAFVKNSSGLFNVFRASKFMGALPTLLPKVNKAVKNWAGDMGNIIKEKRNINQITKLDKKFLPDMTDFYKHYMNTPGRKLPAEYSWFGNLMKRKDSFPKHLRTYLDKAYPTAYKMETPLLKQLWHSTTSRLPMKHNYLLGAQTAAQDLRGLLRLGV